MAKYSINDITLSNIATPIKTLMGLSSELTPDQMATQLNSANTAVTDALTVISEKGVTVPNGSGVDALAGLIAAIESGGGSLQATGDFAITGSVSGTYTPASQTSRIFVNVPAGITPKIAFIYPITTVDYSSYGYTSLFECIFISAENPYQATIDNGISVSIAGVIGSDGDVSIKSSKYRIANIENTPVGLTNITTTYGSGINKTSIDSTEVLFQRAKAKTGASFPTQGFSVGTTYQWYVFY